MKQFAKVLGIHFGIFVLYTVLLALLVDGGIFAAFWLSIVHCVAGLVLGIVFIAKGEETRMSGFGHLAGGFVVVLVGFGSCFLALATIH